MSVVQLTLRVNARVSPEGKIIVSPRYEAGVGKRQLDGARFLAGVYHTNTHTNLEEVDYVDGRIIIIFLSEEEML